MIHSFIASSLVLVASILYQSTTATAGHLPAILHSKKHNLAGLDKTDLPSPEIGTLEQVLTDPYPSCDKFNGTQLTGTNITHTWTLLCDADLFAQDIYPFLLTEDFDQCKQACEKYQSTDPNAKCAAFVFAPGRRGLANNCYLKSGTNDIVSPAALHLIGGVLKADDSLSLAGSGSPVADKDDGSNKEDGRVPTVARTVYLGTSVDQVAKQYVNHAPVKPHDLAGTGIDAGGGANVDLINHYPLASDTGTWTVANVGDQEVAEMTVTPRISRDGGRGGNINGTNVFIFCDTSTYGQQQDPILGYLNGFVSSSIAVDESMLGLQEKPLQLVNSLGQWQDDVGRMRGWIPMTEGEEAYNTAISGQGLRYAIWPNSSPTVLNSTHAIIYAPLVYLQVDMKDQSSPRYTSLGNTLIMITIDPIYGPHAERLQKQLFTQYEINWGSLGGIRAWSSNGPNTAGGSIYLLGQVDNGIMLAKVAADKFNARAEYLYWTGDAWSEQMPPRRGTSNALLIDQPVMNVDIIYSLAHKTFLMIYLTPQADNTFYYRYLQARDNSTLTILPPYFSGGQDDYVEEILRNKWSEQQILFRVPTPERGYIYAGGIHSGYFGEDDIENGGTKMLFTWTEHTIIDPDQPNSGYAHKSQIVQLGVA